MLRPSVKHLFANHDLVTSRCGELIDVTDDLRAVVADSGVADGMALVYSPHTTCAIAINELEDGFLEDFAEALCQLAPEGSYYRHDDLGRRTQGLEADFPNGHSHVRAGLLSSSSQTIPIVDGSLMLGQWQRVFLCELDRARPRKVFMQVLGD
jgi:secondary thiamine-phosphate synthase enzyme